MDVYNERNGIEFVAHFANEYADPTIPATVHWKLDCETTKTVLQDFTPVAFESVTDETGLVDVTALIEIPGSLNAIQDSRNARELKKLLVVSNKDLSNERSEEYQYYVKNLRGRS